MGSPPKKPKITEPQRDPPPEQSTAPQADDTNFQRALSFLRDRLINGPRNGHRDMSVRHSLSEAQRSLEATIKTAITNGQSISLTVYGEAGVGKTLFINRTLANICELFNTDMNNPTVGVVNLNGVVHADERVAFQEIASQLCNCFKCTFHKGASYDENLNFLKEMLQLLHRAMKTVLFVIDHFEHFTKKTKQMVLYNLLDALQSSNIQAVVLGVTSHHDIRHAMEKRVQSRISQRKVTIMAPSTDLTHEEGPLSILGDLLSLPSTFEPSKYRESFNQHVQSCLKDKEVQKCIAKRSRLGWLPRDLAEVAMEVVRYTETEHFQGGKAAGVLTTDHLQKALGVMDWLEDSQVALMVGLSVVELALLVAMKRLEGQGAKSFNFEMVYEEFRQGRQEVTPHLWNKAAAYRGVQALVETGLAQYIVARTEERSSALLQYAALQLQVNPVDIERATTEHPNCPEWLRRWCRNEGQAATQQLL